MNGDWLTIRQGQAPLVLAMPHAGTDIPDGIEQRLVSPWRARKDTDWWIDRLYAFAEEMDATIVRTAVSRSVIDVNRDPSGASLYPGQATTELCPTTTFDGEPLYLTGEEPDAEEIGRRRRAWFDPYHAAIVDELARLKSDHPRVILYDCHAIRSHVPRLFEGELPQFNIGTNFDASCDPSLTRAVEHACIASGLTYVANGRLRGGYTTRHHGRPDTGVHAVQMELACRGYMDEPAVVSAATWPAPFDPQYASHMVQHLRRILSACLSWAQQEEIKDARA